VVTYTELGGECLNLLGESLARLEALRSSELFQRTLRIIERHDLLVLGLALGGEVLCLGFASAVQLFECSNLVVFYLEYSRKVGILPCELVQRLVLHGPAGGATSAETHKAEERMSSANELKSYK
jgi:hypothetical protein